MGLFRLLARHSLGHRSEIQPLSGSRASAAAEASDPFGFLTAAPARTRSEPAATPASAGCSAGKARKRRKPAARPDESKHASTPPDPCPQRAKPAKRNPPPAPRRRSARARPSLALADYVERQREP
jgi:hypothetical protein